METERNTEARAIRPMRLRPSGLQHRELKRRLSPERPFQFVPGRFISFAKAGQ